MNPLVFMVVFMIVVLGAGLAIFFYWRSQYGVWAQERRDRREEHARQDSKAGEQADVIKYD